MNHYDYKRLITELCQAVGLASSQDVLENQHIRIDERPIGLIFDASIARDLIFIYFDLGPISPDKSADLQTQMLKSNLRADRAAMGHFGLHPTTGHAAYHMRLVFRSDLTGEELAQLLSYHVTYLKNWSERLQVPITASSNTGVTHGAAARLLLRQQRVQPPTANSKPSMER